MDDRFEDRGQQLETRAADGTLIRGAANTAGDFLNMIEDGQFSADLHQELVGLAAIMSDHSTATGKKAKGKVTITIDLSTEQIAGGAVFMAQGKYVIKAPEEKRKITMLFTNEHNQFTRTQPRQGQFFGVRDVTLGAGSVREVR